MAKFNVGDHVKVLEETEALRALWGKTGKIEASSEQYFGAVYEILMDAMEKRPTQSTKNG